MVNPADTDAEPTVSTGLLAAKTQNEIPVGTFAEGQSYIHEADMFFSNGMGIFDGLPDCDSMWV